MAIAQVEVVRGRAAEADAQRAFEGHLHRIQGAKRVDLEKPTESPRSPSVLRGIRDTPGRLVRFLVGRPLKFGRQFCILFGLFE